MIQAVFFDFNGVIIDDEPLQLDAYKEVLGREGLAVTEADYFGSLGMDDRAFVRAAYERAERELDDETLARVIEDSPPGIQSARAAGMRTLGVTNTVPDEALRAAGADSVTRSLADWTPDAVHHVFDTEWGK